MKRENAYAKIIRSAEFASKRIELVFVKDTLQAAIRFGDWTNGILNRRALDLPEDELLVLIGDAIAARVFSLQFLDELRGVLESQELDFRDRHMQALEIIMAMRTALDGFDASGEPKYKDYTDNQNRATLLFQKLRDAGVLIIEEPAESADAHRT